MSQGTIRLLLIDDEDDHIVTSHLLSDVGGADFTVDCRNTYESGLAALGSGEYDVRGAGGGSAA